MTHVSSRVREGEEVVRRRYFGLGLKMLFLDLVCMWSWLGFKGGGTRAWVCMGVIWVDEEVCMVGDVIGVDMGELADQKVEEVSEVCV